MDKKPLIGVSICAVVLLVLGSLSNVVGYQSVKSNTINDSPLFQTRTQRATNQQQNSITSQYLGMGRGNPLQFPIKDNKIELLKRVIEYISKMDEQSFSRFVDLCLNRVRQDKAFDNVAYNNFHQMLQLCRNNPAVIGLLMQNNSKGLDPLEMPSIDIWLPGCFFALFMYLVFILIRNAIFTPFWLLYCFLKFMINRIFEDITGEKTVFVCYATI